MRASWMLALPLLVLPVAGQAQSNLSADDLVQMLKPKAGGATRGIRALGESAPAPSPSVAPASVGAAAPRAVPRTSQAMARPGAAAAPAVSEGQGAVNLTVQFENGSDRLTPAATHVLDELGRALTNPTLASYNFKIVGHTDSVGTQAYNQSLSERRAAAVMAYVTSHFSVPAARLEASGVGESEPIVPAREGVAEPRNRRVQILNVGS